MDVTTLVDRALTRPVLVFGSLPPEGRDLDVLVSPPERTAIETVLRDAGFERRGSEWARFTGTNVEVVDVVSVDEWALPPDALDALFEEAIPLPESLHLTRPAPHHALLIVARRAVREGALADKRRIRVVRALFESPDAWSEGLRRAPSWGGTQAVEALRAAYESDGSISASVRASALREEFESANTLGVKAVLSGWKRTLRPPARGHVIALSGLDGSGKSTQAENLRVALERLGHEAVIEWTKIARNSWLTRLTKPVQALLRLRRTETPSSDRTIITGDGPIVLEPEQAAAKELRRKSRVLTHAWTVLVAITSASDHRRATRAHIRAGRIVISDRYTLDTAAHLRYRYGVDKRFRVQSMLNRMLSPSPVLSYFLDVAPEVAFARKAEQYDIADLTLLRRLYLEEVERAGVTVLSGEAPVDELSALMARAAWKAIV